MYGWVNNEDGNAGEELTRVPTRVPLILLSQLEDEPVEDDTRTSMTSRK
jgi:hypothetical protein